MVCVPSVFRVVLCLRTSYRRPLLPRSYWDGLCRVYSSPHQTVVKRLHHPAVAADTTQAAPSDTVSRVRVSRIDAEARSRSVTLRGRTEAKRIVEVTAEVAGQVVSRSVERGMQVARGQLLCEIAIDDREVAVEEARAGLDKAQIEHAGSARLADQGLLSEVAIAASEARRQSAEAHLQRQILNLARTRITAPF